MGELIPIVMFLCIAAVLIMRPITRPLGRYLDSLVRERRGARETAPSAHDPQLARMTELLESISSRMELVEDRVQFMERLVEDRPAGMAQLQGG